MEIKEIIQAIFQYGRYSNNGGIICMGIYSR